VIAGILGYEMVIFWDEDSFDAGIKYT